METNEVLHALNNNVYTTFEVFGAEVWLTETIVSLWIAMAIVIVFALVVRLNMRKWSENDPKGLQNFAELIVEGFDGYVFSIMGSRFKFLGNYFFGITILIWIMNMSGFWLRRPPTADIATTAGLALVTFILIHFFGARYNTKAYFKQYLAPFFIMLPLNIIGELAKPVSLAFRLFGATLGGYIIVTLLYSLLPIWVLFGVPIVAHGVFDLFAGSIQVFIFITLSMTFIRAKCPE